MPSLNPNNQTLSSADAKRSVAPQDAYVLVVEDNLQTQVLITRLLGFTGVKQTEWKSSGRQVLEFADTMPRLDLVLLDIHLPHEDGYEALQKIRADASLSATRVVAMTADSDSQAMQKARQAGFDGFLGKPIDPDKFPAQIKAILRGEPVWDLGYRP